MAVVREKPEQPRKLVWLVDSLDRLTGFPPSVRQKLGFALYQAQIWQKHESAKMLHGFAETAWQVRADDPGGTYRAVYVAEFEEAVYVLHAFQKKATSGIATPRRELDSYAINRKQKYFNKLHAASSSWITLRMEASALWYAASSLLLGRAWLLGWW